MRVLYFHQHFGTPLGAGGLRSYGFSRMLIERGHEVSVVCGRSDKSVTGLENLPFRRGVRRGPVDGISVVEFNLPYSNADGFLKRTLTFLRFSFQSVRLALTEEHDLVFASSTPLTAGIPGIVSRWVRRKPFVFEVRDLWPELPRAMGVIKNPILLFLISLLEWISYRAACRLIGLSPGIMEGIAKRGVPEGSITLIPNGCDLEIFSSASDPWRPEGVRDSDLMAVFSGSHGLANGLESVLDTAEVLAKRGRSDIKIVLIGKGRQKTTLMRRASRDGLGNVVFHEPVATARLAGLLAATDLGLQVLANVPAFYYGTSPNKFFDYIAAGLPVLICYPGWLTELIAENGCGYVVPPDDPEAFADALIHAAEHRDALRAMGRRSSSLAVEKFDRQVLAGRFVEWLEGAVDK
jgi:glycosyltransferase involved in cell wall biosynthesis